MSLHEGHLIRSFGLKLCSLLMVRTEQFRTFLDFYIIFLELLVIIEGVLDFLKLSIVRPATLVRE